MDELKYIAIEGVIGSGKTSLAKKIAAKLEANILLEQFELNPFLKDFYRDRGRFAFQTQMFFLVNRFKQQQEIFQENIFSDTLVSDYLFDKDKIFAYLNLTKEELKLYQSLFPIFSTKIRKPDLVIYLQSNVDRLVYNIKHRKREIETYITRQYLEELSEAYNIFFFKYDATPLLIIDTTELDFINSKTDLEEIFKQIFREDRAKTEYYIPERRRLI